LDLVKEFYNNTLTRLVSRDSKIAFLLICLFSPLVIYEGGQDIWNTVLDNHADF
jgi:hypothetical protein